VGFFSKKKNAEDPASVLSESEIQKKLYGEFSVKTTHAVAGERDHFRESVPSVLPPKESIPQKEPPQDLFSAPKEVPAAPDLLARKDLPAEPKPFDAAPRYVPLHDFEKKSTTAAPASSDVDPYARFRQKRSPVNKFAAFGTALKEVFSKIVEAFKALGDPRRVALRRFAFWTVIVLAIFFLFWGVNALNSQREEALRTRYKIPKETSSIPVPSPAPVETAAAPVVTPPVERPVVITPAPVKTQTTQDKPSPTQSGGAYVIQVVTYPEKQDAEQIVAALKKEGLRAYAKENTRPSGRVYYVVYIGGFRTEAMAQAELLKFRAKEIARPFQDAFVRSTPS